MLDVGLSELLLILAASVVLLRPADVPVVIRAIAKCVRQLKALANSVRHQIRGVAEELGAGTIIDLDGKPQKTYDVGELPSLAAPKHPTHEQ